MSVRETYKEKELLMRIAEGDERAFRSLFDQYSIKLRPYLWKTTGSKADTEDILQETFIKIWMHRDRLPEMENAGGYIYQTAAHTCLNYLRAALNREKKMIELGLLSSHPNAVSATATPLDIIGANFVQDMIRTAVELLSPQQKKIYLLNREEGLKPAAIAGQLNLSVSTVKNHLSDALKQIRSHLIRSGYDINMMLFALLFLP